MVESSKEENKDLQQKIEDVEKEINSGAGSTDPVSYLM